MSTSQGYARDAALQRSIPRAIARRDVASSSTRHSSDDTVGASIREKIEKNRVEELRRLRNIGQLSTTYDNVIINAGPSASARVGTMFLELSRIGAARTEARNRASALKGQVAGPIPPNSWTGSFLDASGRNQSSRSGASGGSSHASYASCEARVRLAACIRRIYDAVPDREDEGFESMSFDRSPLSNPASLSDYCLLAIISAVRRRMHADIGEELWELLPMLPLHVKHRMMALCGRVCGAAPLKAEEARQLWPHAVEDAAAATRIPRPVDDWEDEDEDGIAADAIDDSDDSAHIAPLASQPKVDLSFAAVTAAQLSQLLLDKSSGLNVQLKVLSLAGLQFDAQEDQAIEAILGSLVNLETLSLAGSSHEPGARSARLLESDLALWLAALSRTLPKVRVLDLSCCSWVTHGLVQEIADNRSLFPHMRLLGLASTGFRSSDSIIRRKLYARHINVVL
ncbi:hypothetical protein K437DRAFT_257002 [Tilletiaria anomala UBC 951]|uniref:RNI-like protein n=1 Tax=Tilletiaria anomala (strain ATCC 24038 / CBS 436.72 / UBC 951) TaxID=1037660 RepID=A0A066VWA1_TILAU|nr:uncharacterized protein K437DRAFT_257002 [Tilletiaria anomala UBC 951]KDN44568.1 hypothetical protein K437DRAFT_257002 [Tilletiaria anomala UBC 951]